MAVELQSTSAFAIAQRRFDAAADVLGLSDDSRRLLREVKRELTVHFPVRHDDGSHAQAVIPGERGEKEREGGHGRGAL